MSMVPAICDARGRESKTLFFVSVSWAAVVVKFLLAGMTIPVLGTQPPMTASEFAIATGTILAIWLTREFGEKGFMKLNIGGQP